MMKLSFNPFPSLSTQRLRLRRLEPGDQQEIFALRSDERVNLHLDRQPAKSIEDAMEFIRKINDLIENNVGLYWAICLKENPRLIGTICYFDFNAELKSAELGYELHPFYQHKGIMHEAVSAVIRFAFESIKLDLITAFPTAANESSIRLLERNGFRVDDKQVMGEGNLIRYVLTQKTFSSQHTAH